MPVMDELQDAIFGVLVDADDAGCDGVSVVSIDKLRDLQTQYNLFFLELGQEQVELISEKS